MSRFFSEKYKSLVSYTPGEQPRDMKYIKLNTNESPFPPSAGVLKAVEENADKLVNKYKLFGDDPKSLYLLDQELATRVYTAPSLTL